MLGGLACHPPGPVWELGDPKAFRGHRPLTSELLPSAWPQQVVLGAGQGGGGHRDVRRRRASAGVQMGERNMRL